MVRIRRGEVEYSILFYHSSILTGNMILFLNVNRNSVSTLIVFMYRVNVHERI